MYEQLSRTSPDNPYILSNYGYVKHVLGNSEDGLRLIDRSLEIMPKNAFAYKYLAEIYLKMGETEKACEAIDTGLELGFSRYYGPELENMKKESCE
jgi:tetratricopeptide (TPR) repeat protein